MGRLQYTKDTIASAIDLSANYTSPSVDCRHLSDILLTCVCTGSPSGTFTVQYSVDNKTFYTLLDSAGNNVELALSGSAENLQFTFAEFPAGYLRLSYASGGTGSADIIYSAKGGA